MTGVRARRLRGRLERGSAEVGMDSGIGSDIFRGGGNCCCYQEWSWEELMQSEESEVLEAEDLPPCNTSDSTLCS